MTSCAAPARRRALLAIAAGLAACALPARAAEDGLPLILGIPPCQPYERLQSRFAPLVAHLAEQLGRPLYLRIGQNHHEHLEFVGQAAVDLALIEPVALNALLVRRAPLQLLGRHDAHPSGRLQGHLVVRQDSPLVRVGDLRGHRLAFVDPLSATGYVAPRLLLRRHGLSDRDLLNPRFVGSDGNVAFTVLTGEADAGGIPSDTFAEMADRGLRELAPLPEMPEHAFVSTRRLGTREAASVRETLFSLHRSARGRQILTELRPGLRAIVPARAADYLALTPLIGEVAAGAS